MAFFASIVDGQQDSVVVSSLDTLMITSSRISTIASHAPMAISVAEIGERQPFLSLSSLQEQVNELPGVVTFNNSNYAQDLRISIRGFGARSAFGIRGVKLIVDGIPETTPDGQGQLDNLSLQDIDRIEVLRGASSSLYGNAAGGVITINTKDAKADNPISAALRLGSFGTRQYQLSGGLSSDRGGLFVSMGHQRSDGYRSHSGYQQTNLLTKLQVDIGEKSELLVNLSYMDSPQGQDPGGINLDDATEDRRAARDRNVALDAGEEIQHWKGGLSFRSELDDQLILSTYGFLSGRSFDGKIPLTNGGAIDLSRIYGGHGTQLQYSSIAASSVNQISVGYDIGLQSDDRTRFDNNNGVRGARTLEQLEQFDNIGIFLLDHLSINQWRIQGGLRYDYNVLSVEDRFITDGDDSGSVTLSNLNPSLGVSRLLGENKTVYANYSTSFETPTLSELAANPSGDGGFNTALKPQIAKSAEIGWRQQVGKLLNYELSLYYITTKDESIPFELASQQGRIFYRNAGETRRSGVEISSNWTPHADWTLRSTYSYSDIRYDNYEVEGEDLSDNAIPGLPSHSGSLSINYSTETTYFRIQGNHVGALFADDANVVSVDAYNVIALQVGGYIDFPTFQLIPSLAVNNLLNAQYFDNIRVNAFGSRYYEPASSRFIQAGITVRLK